MILGFCRRYHVAPLRLVAMLSLPAMMNRDALACISASVRPLPLLFSKIGDRKSGRSVPFSILRCSLARVAARCSRNIFITRRGMRYGRTERNSGKRLQAFKKTIPCKLPKTFCTHGWFFSSLRQLKDSPNARSPTNTERCNDQGDILNTTVLLAQLPKNRLTYQIKAHPIVPLD